MNLKQILCRHKENDVICWHWTHGVNGNEPRFIEIQLKCKNCHKYHFTYIKDRLKCVEFSKRYSEKEWSDKCKPML